MQCCCMVFFFFKQKTAYEVRISDWSSDVCSFDLVNTPRIVTRDCEKLGVKFRAGDMVLCLLPMAGWDALKNDSPEKFDIDREKRSYLTFSTGPHLCLDRKSTRLNSNH